MSKLPVVLELLELRLNTCQKVLAHIHTRRAVNNLLAIANIYSLTIEATQQLDFIAEGLKHTKIPNLNLSSNIVGSLTALALSKNNAIKRLNLMSSRFLNDANTMLSLMLNNANLISIDLRFVLGITPAAIGLLAKHPKLRAVSIGSNNDPIWTEQFKDTDVVPILGNYRLVEFDIPNNASISGDMKINLKEHLEQNTIAMRQLFINQMLVVFAGSPVNNPFASLPIDLLKIIFEYVGRDFHVLNDPNVTTAAINLVCSNVKEKTDGKRNWQTTIKLSDKMHTVFKKWDSENRAGNAEARYKLAIAQERAITATLQP